MDSSSLSNSDPMDLNKMEKSSSLKIPDILDPNDVLMERFQNALHAHLTRIDGKLLDDIVDLEANIKSMEEKRELETLKLYNAQQQIKQQETTIKNYKNTLNEIISMRETKDQNIIAIEESHKRAKDKLQNEKMKEEQLMHELKKLKNVELQFVNWEKELSNYLLISEKISKKDQIIQRELINEKYQKDYILYELENEVFKIEEEIIFFQQQLKLKENEKIGKSQSVADADADLQALHKERGKILNIWNTVVTNISKQDKICTELNFEYEKLRESCTTLDTEMENLKKELNKEMELNEQLTSSNMKIENDTQIVSKMLANDNEKMKNLESGLIKLTKMNEQGEIESNAACADYKARIEEDEKVNKDYGISMNEKTELDNKVLLKLEDKLIYDKSARHLNKLLIDCKKFTREQELLLDETENSYSKTMFELERMKNDLTNSKDELQDYIDGNTESERKIDEIEGTINKFDMNIERKQKKIVDLNKTIDEMMSNDNGREMNPQKLKILSLEKYIQEIEQKNRDLQQNWLRRQSIMINLREQRETQIQDINLLMKQIMIMEQKNYKLEHALDKLNSQDINTSKTFNALQHELIQMNANLAMQKELSEQLADENDLTKNHYVVRLKDEELNLIRLENNFKEMVNEKLLMQDELNMVQRESLSWEKKIQIVNEITMKFKDERSTGGDLTIMKCEIHKMEMRLLHLKKAQEKLIQDMEYCVVRRDVILDKMLGKVKRDTKSEHNQKIIFCKRLDDQKLKIKQIVKETKQTESKIQEHEIQLKEMIEQLEENEKTIDAIKRDIPTINDEIQEMEVIKFCNLKTLVLKQRKVKLLQDIKNHRYKFLHKNEISLNEDLNKARDFHSYMKEIMEQTRQDFPLFANDICRILLTLQI